MYAVARFKKVLNENGKLITKEYKLIYFIFTFILN